VIRQVLLRCIIAAALGSQATHAKPPANPDPTLSPWFESLEDPETTLSCCDETDCRPVDDRIGAAGYEVLLRGAWVPVPDAKIIRRTDNPVGRAVLCWSPNFGIMCFVPGPAV
jgi:hypothetical protein